MQHETMLLLLGIFALAGFELTSAQQQMEARAGRKGLRSLQDTPAVTSPHGGAYSGATVHEILVGEERGKIHTNWVPVEGEILQYCGMDGNSKCEQVKLSYVKRQTAGLLGVHKGHNDGQEIFFVEFWPPVAATLPAEAPINKAGTDATHSLPAWSNADCIVTDKTLLKKWKAKPGQTHKCKSLVVETEALFDFFHLPKFTGRAPLAIGLAGFASLALLSSMVVAVSRRMRARFCRSGTYTEALTSEVLQADENVE